MYRVGDEITLTFRFVADGTLVDPTAVTAEVELPDASIVEPAPEQVGVGEYRVTFTPALAGQHVVVCVGTGDGARTHSDVINVAAARSAALASLADLKAHLNMGSDVTDDDELRSHLEAATSVVEQHVCQIVARRTFTERHFVHRGGVLLLDHTPVLSISALTSEDGDIAWQTGDLDVDQVTGEVCPVEGASSIVGNVEVTYLAGYAAVPPNISLAALIIAAHLWETQRFSSVVSRGGEDSFTPMAAGFAVPNRAVELLGGRPPVIA